MDIENETFKLRAITTLYIDLTTIYEMNSHENIP